MSSPALSLRAPLLWLLLPLMTGFTAAQWWPLPAGGPRPLLALAAITIVWALFSARRERPLSWQLAIVLTTGLVGFLYLHGRFPYLHEWASRPPREATVTVDVMQVFPGAPGSRSLTGIGTINPATADETLRGRRISFSVIRRLGPAPQRAGTYRMQGVLAPLSPDGTGFSDYLANVGVRHCLTRARVLAVVDPPGRFQQFCTAAEHRLQVILGAGLADQPAPRSLYLAMLLGEKAVLSPDQQNAFVRSGTFHIFSISGLHVGIISIALQFLLRTLRVPRPAATGIILPVLWLYVQITGGSSPALRSFLMVACLLSAKVFRQPGNAFAALTLSALAILLIEPLQLFSTGFQMSYTVVAALLLMGTPLSRRWLARWQPFALLPPADWRWWHKLVDRRGRNLISLLATGWTAFLASAPAGIGFFNLFSPGSLLANLVIVPLSSVVIYTGFLSLVAGLAGLTPLSALLNQGAAAVIVVTDRLLQHGVALPGVFFAAQFRAAWLAPASLALMTATMLAGAATRWPRRVGGYWLPVIVLVLMIILGVKFG